MLKGIMSFFSKKDPGEKEKGPTLAGDFERWNELPPEIMRKIFAMLDSQSDLQAVSKVCRYWNSIANDPLLWMNAFLNPTDGSPFAIIPKIFLTEKEFNLDPMHENWKSLCLKSIPCDSLEDAFFSIEDGGYIFVREGVHITRFPLTVQSDFKDKIVIMGVSRERSVLQCYNNGLIRHHSKEGTIIIKNLTIAQREMPGDSEPSWVIISTERGLKMEDCNVKSLGGGFGFRSENCKAIIKNCDISSETSVGVYTMLNAQPTFIDCKIHGCKMSGNV